ncbi:MAG: rhodanese-like domain-containing protein [Psychroflexus sp.]|nr:rhodanese-like domain-containing protein [Psychroflexus sp.]MDN6310445.1 rhodanese-like domain-containing protein [Psychroflexus sp.]
MHQIEVINKKKYADIISEKKVQLVDVRTPEEFSEGSISHAQNINVMSPDFIDQIEEFSKSEPVYVYCKSGARSLKAAEIMVSRGFSKVIDLEGGYMNWIDA